MQISHTHKLADYSIGRIRAAAEWRAANAPGGQADRLTAVQELIREAQEYGADAIIGWNFTSTTSSAPTLRAPPSSGSRSRGLLSSSRTRGDRLAQKVGPQPPTKVSSLRE
jgi:hypothetical protein